MKKQKLNKGITLIALIITIIVLLILATVSVKLIVDNGIVDRSKNATSKYTIAEEKEKIALAYNGYKIARLEIEPNPEEQDLLERFFLGENKEGRYWRNDIYNSYEYKFVGNEIIPDADTQLKITGIMDNCTMTFLYNGREYQLTINNRNYITEKVELINATTTFTIEGAEVNGSEKRGWKIRFNKTGNAYELKVDGEIINGEGVTEELELLERYFLGENGETVFWDSIHIFGCYGGTFKDNPIIPEASTKIKELGSYGMLEDGCEDYFVEYENKIYEVKVKAQTEIVQSVKIIYDKKGREGQRVKYSYDGTTENEKDWLIVHDYGETVEIMSLETLGSLKLGKEDETAVGSDDIEKAIYSYNNAVKRIHEYTNSLIINPNKISVRAAGSNPDNPLSENNEMYVSEKLGKYSGKLKCQDNNAKRDFVLILYYMNEFENFQSFFMPSREIREESNRIWFGIVPEFLLFRYENKYMGGTTYEPGYEPNTEEYNCPVIPMVTINADSIKQ